jgi:hypothetical protein
MFRTTRCGHPLAEMAAINCVRSFQQMLGETIFAGRLNESQLRQLQVRAQPRCPRRTAPSLALSGFESGRRVAGEPRIRRSRQRWQGSMGSS